MKGIVVIGAGGHAKVVIDTLRAQEREVACCVADAAAPGLDVPLRQGDSHLEVLRREGFSECVVAIGDNARRVWIADKALTLGFRLITAISPHAMISPSAKISAGTVVMPGAVINSGAVVHELAIINTCAVVEHDCEVGRGAHLAPQVGIAGGVKIGALAFLGIGAKVIPGRTIGAGAIVGAGAVVITDVPDRATVVGVPARVVKK